MLNRLLLLELLVVLLDKRQLTVGGLRLGDPGSVHQTNIKDLCWGPRLVAPPIS